MRIILRHNRYSLGLLALGLLAGCGGAQQSSALGTLPLSQSRAVLQPPASSDRLNLSTVDGHHIYVTNASYSVPSVTVYTRNAQGNAAPIQTISGSNTGLVQPMGVA